MQQRRQITKWSTSTQLKKENNLRRGVIMFPHTQAPEHKLASIGIAPCWTKLVFEGTQSSKSLHTQKFRICNLILVLFVISLVEHESRYCFVHYFIFVWRCLISCFIAIFIWFRLKYDVQFITNLTNYCNTLKL